MFSSVLAGREGGDVIGSVLGRQRLKSAWVNSGCLCQELPGFFQFGVLPLQHPEALFQAGVLVGVLTGMATAGDAGQYKGDQGDDDGEDGDMP